MRINTERKRVIVVIEYLSYDYLQKCNTPNIDSLDPHPAWSQGSTTRASVAAILGGFLPICAVKGCYHQKLFNKWTYPYTLTDYREKNALFLYVPNGWVLELLESYIRPDLKPLIQKWLSYHDTRDMINDFLSRKEKRDGKGYYAYFHVMETHPPYYPEERGIEDREERRKAAVEYVDRILKPLIDLDCDDLIVTSDHNGGSLTSGSLAGEHPIKIFMACRIKPGESKI